MNKEGDFLYGLTASASQDMGLGSQSCSDFLNPLSNLFFYFHARRGTTSFILSLKRSRLMPGSHFSLDGFCLQSLQS